MFPGVVVRARAIGMFRMTDEMGRDDKVLAVLRRIHGSLTCTMSGMCRVDRLEIQHFFEVYKALEPGKGVEGDCWAGRADAEFEIEASRQRLAAAGARR